MTTGVVILFCVTQLYTVSFEVRKRLEIVLKIPVAHRKLCLALCGSWVLF